jgi:tetratricopeptide (TPR) repeat protein
MGIFDFFKKKKTTEIQTSNSEEKLSKEEVDNLVLLALDTLCNNVSTLEDAKNLIQSKGYNERQTNIILNRADELYQKHFKNNIVSSENPKRVSDSTFNSIQFQKETYALALWKIEESDYKIEAAIKELKNIGLDYSQTQIILERVKPYLNSKLDENFQSNVGIDEKLFQTETYQNNILVKAENLYQKNILNYELVKFNLLKEGLNISQADIIIDKLYKKVTEIVNDFQNKLDSGEISEIKIIPNPEHTKGNVDDDQIDRYIAYGASQMDKGYLDNALELFNKAIELNDKATLAYANKGKLYSLKNDNEKALEFTNKALEIEPNHIQILDNKIDIVYDLLLENKISETEFIANVKNVLQKDSENPNALIYIIQYFLKQNEFDNALQNVKKLFKNHYREPITIQLMLNTLGQLPEEEAINQFRIIESEVNEEAKYQLKYNMGLYLKGIGKFDDAIELYEDLNKVQEFSWNFYQIAIMKNLQGKTEESLKFLRNTFDLEAELKEDAKNFPELQNIWTNPEFIEMTK